MQSCISPPVYVTHFIAISERVEDACDVRVVHCPKCFGTNFFAKSLVLICSLPLHNHHLCRSYFLTHRDSSMPSCNVGSWGKLHVFIMHPPMRSGSTGCGSIGASTSGIRQATGASSPAGASEAGCGSAWPSDPSAAGCSGTAGLSGWFCSLISTLRRAEFTTWPSGLRVKNALSQAEIQSVTAAGAPKDRPVAVGD